MKARIAGIGAYAPERVVTNDQLSEIVDTSDEWIRSRTGITISPATHAASRP